MIILIINHIEFDSTYGAATSLRKHLELFKEKDIDNKFNFIVLNRVPFKELFFNNKKIQNLEKKYNIEIKNFWGLPFEGNFDGADIDVKRKNFLKLIKNVIIKIFYKYSLIKIIKIIQQKEISIVHFNSSVLIKIANDIKSILTINSPYFILHVRDFLRNDLNKKQIESFNIINKFVCIDLSTQIKLFEVLGKNYFNKSVVLQNLFLRPDNKVVNRVYIPEKFKNSIKYLIVGRISRLKGVKFVLNTFLKSKNNTVLIIIGDGDGDYYKEVCDISNFNKDKVLLLNEISSLSDTDIYSISDFLIRGDESFRTGRTVYEALSYNTKIILPGNKFDLDSDNDLKYFTNDIILYKPNSETDLLKIFNYTSNQKPIFNSNSDQYFQEKSDEYFFEFINLYSF
jgi:hypothetical protein